LRKRLAEEQHVPSYVVFSDASLRDMAARAPLDLDAFAGVSGVGGYKRDRYGEVFLKAIKDYLEGITDKTELNPTTHVIQEHVEPERPEKTDPAPADTWQDPSGNRQASRERSGNKTRK
jgi:ATP-dependent DNA helicase RecQ